MDQRTSRWRTATPPATAETILESRYAQLLQWGEMLARGDRGVAHEIVHDLCLQLTLATPDFSQIANPDGYLYTCLRHVYLSRLSRASREAVRFVSIADCDSVKFAIETGQRIDSLEVQNVLRRICCYAVWRKEQTKSFSYFILHFFHGYFHREIAELACVPAAAVYNKLKTSRIELKIRLEEPEKLRLFNREAPPEASLSWNTVSSDGLFRELRRTILDARRGECLPEENLLGRYQNANSVPFPCELLAHIVSCERCLAVVDRHLRRPTLNDRDFLDGLGRSPGSQGEGGGGKPGTKVPSLRSHSKRIFEHRPATLSIAVDGKIVASHDVRGEYSLLSAMIQRPESVQFVEVFSGQNIRLALLPIENRPPEGQHVLTQKLVLSDDRWLELKLEFDVLGLSSQVAYFDPALALDPPWEDSDESLFVATAIGKSAPESGESRQSKYVRIADVLEHLIRRVTHSPILAWTLTILLLLAGGVGYLVFRSSMQPLSAQAILSKSIRTEAAALQGRAEHKDLSFEEIASDGHPFARGTIDVWRDGTSGRYMRRLYDSQHRLIAAEWKTKAGVHGSYVAEAGRGVSGAHQLTAGDFWMQDVSAAAFEMESGRHVRVTATEHGFELEADVRENGRPQLVSATLVLNRSLMPVGEILRMRRGSAVRQIRLMQTGFETEAASSAPDSVFDPRSLVSPNVPGSRSSIAPRLRSRRLPAEATQLCALEIGVLYQLNNLGVDSGEPIEVERTPDHRIRVVGTVPNTSRKTQIIAALRSLPDQQALEIHLISQQEMRLPVQAVAPEGALSATVYNIVQKQPPADPILRRYFEDHRPRNGNVDAAAAQFEHEALTHAQRALQHAYALDRLGSDFTTQQLRSVDSASRQQWAEMVASHAAALRAELQALHSQMAEIGIPGNPAVAVEQGDIDNLAQFAHVSRLLLKDTQVLNHNAGLVFASEQSRVPERAPGELLAAVSTSIPLAEVRKVFRLAARLTRARQQGSGSRTRTGNQRPAPPR